MNPVILLIAILFLGNPGTRRNVSRTLGQTIRKYQGRPRVRMPMPPLAVPGYIDTFKMELLLDRLRNMTYALEKINTLNQKQRVPVPKDSPLPVVDRVSDSLDAVKGFLADGKSSKQIDSLSGALSSVKKLGDMEQLMSTFGPILSMLTNSAEK